MDADEHIRRIARLYQDLLGQVRDTAARIRARLEELRQEFPIDEQADSPKPEEGDDRGPPESA